MEKQRSYTEDELVQMYQDGVITLVDFICMHPERWEDEFISQMDPAKEYGAVLIEMY